MPAPSRLTFEPAVLNAMNTELLGYLDPGSHIRLWSETDVLIAEFPLDDPAGAVDGTTGVLTLEITDPDLALVTAVCTYATVEDPNDDVVFSVPVQEGPAPVGGFIVLNSTNISQGVLVTILSATIE